MNLTSMLPLGHYWRPWMALGLILLLSACVPTAGPTSDSPAPTTATEEPMTETVTEIVTDTATMTNTDVLTDSATMSNTAPMSDLSAVEQQLVERAMEIVATEAGVTTADLTLINLQPMEWPDSSLGCPQPGTMYMQVITPGYQLTLEDVSGTTYNIHTGLDPSGQVMLCQEAEEAMSNELTGTVWQWQTDTLTDSANYTIEFLPDGGLAVQADCNRGRSSYELFGENGLRIDALAMTRAMCPPGSQDGAFIEQVVSSSSYIFDGENLILYPVVEPGTMIFTQVAAGEAQSSGVLTGTVIYLQRIALTPGEVIDVQLQDVSKMDVAATIIAQQTIMTQGENVPIPFELTYDPEQIDPRFTYALSASITIEGQLRWINTERYTVLTNGAPMTGVEVVVKQVQ